MKKKKPLTDIHIRKTVRGFSLFYNVFLISNDVNTFVKAVSSVEQPHYYLPEEITPDMYSRRIRIVGGHLDGYEGYLLTTRGSKTKRLLVELPTLLAASVEVEPEFIQLLNEKR